MAESKKLKITFAPGAFDNFEGTQEELDEVVKKLKDEDEWKRLLDESAPQEINFADMLENGEEDELESMLENLINQQARKLQ